MTESERFCRGRVLNRESIAIMGAFDSNDPLIAALAQDIIGEGATDLVFDLRNTSHLTSPGIACLIKVLKKVQAVKGSLYVYGATHDMIELLNLTRIGKYLHFL